jgi:hypothetical protein
MERALAPGMALAAQGEEVMAGFGAGQARAVALTSPLGAWWERSVDLVAGPGWTRMQGSADSKTVLASTEPVFIELDVICGIGPEADVDNITFVPAESSTVPEPASALTTWGAVKQAYR